MAGALDAVKMGNVDAVRMEERHRSGVQFHLTARGRAFRRTTWIIALVGVVLICLTLFNLPKIDGGYPVLLNHEVLFTFAIGSVIGILLNLFIFLMHLFSHINRRKSNETADPFAVKLIEQFEKKKINRTERYIAIAEMWLCASNSLFCFYVFVVAVMASFLPYRDVISTGYICSPFVQIASYLCLMLLMLFNGDTYYAKDNTADNNNVTQSIV